MAFNLWSVIALLLLTLQLIGHSFASETGDSFNKLDPRSHILPRDYENRRYFAVELTAESAPTACQYGDLQCIINKFVESSEYRFEEQIGSIPHMYLFSCAKDAMTGSVHGIRARSLQRSIQPGYLEELKLHKWEKRSVEIAEEHYKNNIKTSSIDLLRRDGSLDLAHGVENALGIHDPEFEQQWHLINLVQKGHDINITGVWFQNITGEGIVTAIVDDGLDFDSLDLKDNYFAKGSYDFNDLGPDPKPRLADDKHGTRCAGEIAAVRNDVCGIGAAYKSKVAGIRILSKQVTDADEAIALNYAMQDNDIYSCSWGPADDGKSMEAPGSLIVRAFINGVENGRNGKGSIYVFASGNGAANGDNCNFDGYTNSIYSITVGAIDRKGLHPFYAEDCSAQLVVTYSSGSNDHIHTTDVGERACTSGHGGTSAAAPLAAGIFALVLSIRPDLTWRDMQYLALNTAVRVDNEDAIWQETANGKPFSHRYGYGNLDSYTIVEAAKDWQLVKPQAWYDSRAAPVHKKIPYGDGGFSSFITIDAEDLKQANLERVEHVQVTVNIRHHRRGDVSVKLTSPFGVSSLLATSRPFDDSAEGMIDWTFMSVAHWGETGIGTWTLTVYDTAHPNIDGVFEDWKLRLWGESIDPAKAKPYPIPKDPDNKVPFTSTTVVTDVPVTTTEVPAVTTTTSKTRPTITSASPASSVIASPGEHDVDEGKDDDEKDYDDDDDDDDDEKKNSPLSRLLPTFGLQSDKVVWIYGAGLLIVGFVALLGVWYGVQRRKNGGGSGRQDEGYEFEVLRNTADLEQGGSGNGGSGDVAGGRKSRKTRDLYNAFENIDEDDAFAIDDLLSSDEDDEERVAMAQAGSSASSSSLDSTSKKKRVDEDKQRLLSSENH
ncbi:peptidase S8/S53 domain-containing protein [Lipomyces japonicus]|uniref:peptidase S8/S53 domain-containing protein n=1 Tax=Lipomyces japonicus TaxID=56871 RepID=UPI0034CD5F84